jgi:hypothetical protein
MPLRAFINDEEVLAPFISDTDWQVLKSQKPNIVLPCCGQYGFFRVSKLGTKHFVHKNKTGCNWNSETWQHLLTKTEIVKACKQAGYEAKTEVSASDWRADILATKQSNQGLIQVALEVQWSPQTLEVTKERQAKYQRDKVRCCWLFRRLPTEQVSRELPMFKLVFHDNSPVVETHYGNMALTKFVESLLRGEFRFCEAYRLAIKQTVTLVFFPVDCWKCRRKHHIYYIQGNYRSVCNKSALEPNCGLNEIPLHFRPEIIKAALTFLRTEQGKFLRMGTIQTRYSKTVGDSYLSFGCPWCNAILGDHYYFEEVSTAFYCLDNTQKVFHEVELTSAPDLLKWTSPSHWCYSPDRVFCV